MFTNLEMSIVRMHLRTPQLQPLVTLIRWRHNDKDQFVQHVFSRQMAGELFKPFVLFQVLIMIVERLTASSAVGSRYNAIAL